MDGTSDLPKFFYVSNLVISLDVYNNLRKQEREKVLGLVNYLPPDSKTMAVWILQEEVPVLRPDPPRNAVCL